MENKYEKNNRQFTVSVALGVILGIIVGQLAGSGLMHVVVTIKYILNQVIVFCVPLIIIGFIAPSITRLGNNASKMLGVAIIIAYVSSIGAALFFYDGRFPYDSPPVHCH